MLVPRRSFLSRTLGLGAAALWMPRGALALTTPPDRMLVVVQLTGGNDGLNTVIPYQSPAYRLARPTLAVDPRDVLRLDDSLGLHPQLTSLDKLLQDGNLAIVPSAGYPQPDRSHFQSMAVWHTGRLQPDARTAGWLQQALAVRRTAHPMSSIHLSDTPVPQSLLGGGTQPTSMNDPSDMLLRHAVTPAPAPALTASCSTLNDEVRTALEAARAASQRLKAVAQQDPSQDTFPSLRRRLRLTHRLLEADLGATIIHTEIGGFDTHANQANSHPLRLRDVGDSLLEFQSALRASGLHQRVLTLVFSEFGRRLRENASAGTDHGTAGPVFLMGEGVNPGIHGAAPDLDTLVDGDPVHRTDFRSIYATVLEKWLKTPSHEILGETHSTLPLLRSA